MHRPRDPFPNRIVCLTEETTETLYALGEEDRIVGISGFTVRPPRARKEKPKVSAFTSAKYDKILALKPDLVLGFSDLQGDITADLARLGLEVHLFNQRSVADILAMIRRLGALVGKFEEADNLSLGFEQGLERIAKDASGFKRRPRVYFEEWNDPLMSGIQWVAELIRIAGGEDCFPELAAEPMAKQRIIADPLKVVERQPDIILGSWCGKRFRPERVAERPGWQDVPAVRDDQIFEIKSAVILQPGPAALSEGVSQMHQLFKEWSECSDR